MSGGGEGVSEREKGYSCLCGDGEGAMASASRLVRVCCVLVGVSGRGSLCSGLRDEGESGNGNRMGSESGKCCLCVLRALVGVSEKV